MRGKTDFRNGWEPGARGFSLVEMMISIAILVIVVGVMFQFLAANQNRYRSQQLLAEVSQGARSALEIMALDLNQAGYNPPFQVNLQLSSAVTATGSLFSVPLSCSGSGCPSPVTRGIFYGSRLVVGNTCGSSGTNCDQEEVVVNNDPTYLSGTASNNVISSTNVPLVLTTSHASSEPVFSRNYPFPTGIYYDYRPTTGSSPWNTGIADNKIRFYGDIKHSGDLYYGEYRLQCYGSTAGTFVDACTTGCTSGPFVLTRFLTKLADSNSVFKIPASKSAALTPAVSPLVDNIEGSCATAPTTPSTSVVCSSLNSSCTTSFSGDWLVYTAPDEAAPTNPTSSPPSTNVYAAIDYTVSTPAYVRPVLNSDGTPAIWFKVRTYGGFDCTVCSSSSPAPNPYFQAFVIDVRIALTVQESQLDPVTHTVQVQRLRTHIVPKNINDALVIAQSGGSLYLPGTPYDPNTGYALPLP